MTGAPHPVLTVADLVAGYGDENVLHGVSLEVPQGEIVVIIGPNGSGKSTALKSIYGLVPPRGGTVAFRDASGTVHSLAGRRPYAITRLGMNMVPQLANVFPDLSVRENLEIGSSVGREPFAAALPGVLEIFPALSAALPKRAATLSGGQRQMLGIARAMISGPTLLILDEPSAGLAPAIVDHVFATIRGINATGVSILMVEQKARQCLAFADRAYVLDMGRTRISGSGAELLADQDVIDAYLGSRGRLDLAALARRKQTIQEDS